MRSLRCHPDAVEKDSPVVSSDHSFIVVIWSGALAAHDVSNVRMIPFGEEQALSGKKLRE